LSEALQNSATATGAEQLGNRQRGRDPLARMPCACNLRRQELSIASCRNSAVAAAGSGRELGEGLGANGLGWLGWGRGQLRI